MVAGWQTSRQHGGHDTGSSMMNGLGEEGRGAATLSARLLAAENAMDQTDSKDNQRVGCPSLCARWPAAALLLRRTETFGGTWSNMGGALKGPATRT